MKLKILVGMEVEPPLSATGIRKAMKSFLRRKNVQISNVMYVAIGRSASLICTYEGTRGITYSELERWMCENWSSGSLEANIKLLALRLR